MATPIALALALACGDPAPTPPDAPPQEAAPRTAGPSLVLVTLDTTRADHMGAYGHDAAKTPVFDAFAGRGVRFDRAYATVPLTTPSHASMLTGLYPPHHGVHNNGDAVLSPEHTTLAEHLHDQGYATAASVSAFVTTRMWGLDQGFDAYFDSLGHARGPSGRWGRERRADAVVDDLIAWLDARGDADGPVFLWAHLYDAHHPYEPPAPFDEAFPDAPYDGEIAFADAQVGRLRDAVRERLGDDVAWIVVADHGEAFDGEHGEHEHGMFLFDTTVHIPFVVMPAGGLDAPAVVGDLAVSHADVTPTALGLLGMDVPEGLDGVDLSAFARGDRATRGPVYMESELPLTRFGFHPEIAVAEGTLKVFATPNPRVFDVAHDPGETRDLSAERGPLLDRLGEIGRSTYAERGAHEASAPSPEVYEQLAALGYISGAAPTGAELPTQDAKDQTATIRKLDEAMQLAQTPGRARDAVAAYQAVLADAPQIGEARMGLARALSELGRQEEAEAAYRDAIALQPTSTVLKINLANCLAAQGRQDEGLELMRNVLQQVPGDNLARVGLLRMLIDTKAFDEAVALTDQWLAENPDDLSMRSLRGVARARQGATDEAARDLRASLADGVPRQLVHRTLAQIAAQNGDLDKALYHQELESLWFPDNREVRRTLADMLMAKHRWADAATEFGFLVETGRGPQPILRLGWAQAIYNAGDYELAGRILEPALRAAPNNPNVLLLHANLLAKAGQRDEAQAVFERASALHAAGPRQVPGAPGAP